MSCTQFIGNLEGLNDGQDFPKELLKVSQSEIAQTHMLSYANTHPTWKWAGCLCQRCIVPQILRDWAWLSGSRLLPAGIHLISRGIQSEGNPRPATSRYAPAWNLGAWQLIVSWSGDEESDTQPTSGHLCVCDFSSIRLACYLNQVELGLSDEGLQATWQGEIIQSELVACPMVLIMMMLLI